MVIYNFFGINGQADPIEIYMEIQKPQNCQNNLKKGRTKLADLHFSISKYSETKTVQYCIDMYRYTDRWNRIKCPQVNFYSYQQLVFDEGAKAMQWGKVISSTNGAGTTGYPHTNELS